MEMPWRNIHRSAYYLVILALYSSTFDIESFAGFWGLVVHISLYYQIKEIYASYFRVADKYVFEAGGENSPLIIMKPA